MKYWLFEKSAVERLINLSELQSLEFEKGSSFVAFLKGTEADFRIDQTAAKKTKNGIIFAGTGLTKTFLLIDLEKCRILEIASDNEIITILQKLFRFCIRYWGNMGYTSCERIYKTKATVFPFAFSAGAAYHIVLWREPEQLRLSKRGIVKSVLAYKYDNDSTAALEKAPNPDLGVYRNGGEEYLGSIAELRTLLDTVGETPDSAQKPSGAIDMIESNSLSQLDEFRYLPYEKQMAHLTMSQRKVIQHQDMTSPIRVEGPAGTGKTASLVLRAFHLLREAERKNENLHMVFFTHSKSTESVVKGLFNQLSGGKWMDPSGRQYLRITTLLDYCADYTNILDVQMIDRDAAEAKQSQLDFIREAYLRAQEEYFDTCKYLMSEKARQFFEKENVVRIVLMLQHEFSVRIKGASEGELERYKKLQRLESGLPAENEDDKEYIFRIFRLYQEALEILAVYDTDDVILEALARLNAPLWRRNRSRDGFDYLFVDEMHLFNLNEQQVFHFLTKDAALKSIPICFALDYSQAIGERGDITDNYFEKEVKDSTICVQKYATVFRSSQQIAEFCASITASGAMLFQHFIDPYKTCKSGFIEQVEENCPRPKLLMYQNDRSMMKSVGDHVRSLVNQYKCQPSEIAVIVFDEELAEEYSSAECQLGGYGVNLVLSKNIGVQDRDKRRVTVSFPEYVNGLEFKAVILLGVDRGRVPQSGIMDISQNFLRYNALNKLYLASSRAQYCILILGSQLHGVSECLQHSIANGMLEKEEVKE